MSITVDNSAVKRIEDLRKQQGKDALVLRITVEGGGCSGFQYNLQLTDATNGDDIKFGSAVVTDSVSLPYLEGSVVSFEDGLIGSQFKIENPNAQSGCGCGGSFSV
jgi:iron-sulfur cluster insertion protein